MTRTKERKLLKRESERRKVCTKVGIKRTRIRYGQSNKKRDIIPAGGENQ